MRARVQGRAQERMHRLYEQLAVLGGQPPQVNQKPGGAAIKDPAAATTACGWCRLTGLTPLMLWTASLLAIRNQRILNAWNKHQDDNARRAAAGLPPRTRKKRRPAPALTTT